MDLVSIVLPVYNGEQYLSKSIESVLSQTYKNIELIIVNDCSTDSTAEIIDNFIRKDKRVKCINNPTNLKLPESLNVGFSAAKGKYYTWTSDDNLYKPEAIEWMVNYLNQNVDVDLVSCIFDLIDEKDHLVGTSNQFYVKKRHWSDLVYYNNVGACFLYRNSIAKLVGEYDKKLFLAEDYDYWMRLAIVGNIKYVDENLYSYRIHSQSLTSMNSNVNLMAEKVFIKNIDFFEKKLFNYLDSIELSEFQINRIRSNLSIKKSHVKKTNSFYINKILPLFGVTKKNSIEKLKKINYLDKYVKSIKWIEKFTVNGLGIAVSSRQHQLIYPEVTGYFIPSLIKFGYRNIALNYGNYLISIQNKNGFWTEPSGKTPYTFDTGMILKGLCSLIDNNLDSNDKFKTALIRGADYIISKQREDGSIATEDYSYWNLPYNKVVPESIHIYCLEPIRFAGKITNDPKYELFIQKALKYYLSQINLTDFSTLSHFNAYIIEGLIDIGEVEKARRAMELVSLHQRFDGSISAYSNVDFICSTGLFQYAICWYKLGETTKADSAFDYACELQNHSGGWYGSYTVSRDNANYFPNEEISWAVKYFLDAIYYRQVAKYNSISGIFLDQIDINDERYQIIKKELTLGDYKDILDLGCGKARYTKQLIKEFSEKNYYCVDLSKEIIKNINLPVEKKQGSILNIPYKDKSFDFILVCEVLEHAIDIQNAIIEIIRVLKDKGKIVIIDKDNRALGKLKLENFEKWFDKNEIFSMCQGLGVHVKIIENVSYNNLKDGLFNAWIIEKD